MALIPIEFDWQKEFENVDRLSIEIVSQIQERNKEVPTSEKHNHISAGIRVRLNQFTREVKELKKKLAEVRHDLTLDELERRNRLIEKLESKYIQLNNEFSSINGDTIRQREELLNAGSSGSYWQTYHDDDEPIAGQSDREALLKNVTVQKIKEQNARVLKEQDEGLESLSKIISRQKDIATRIYDEVENQNDLLDGIGNDMDRVDVRMAAETRHITQVVRRPSLCGYYLLVCLLLLALVLVIWLK
uniref:CSON011524 protein n=1 Tax=Culicoides sonorensis TaxID=179676 RepID=A0A336KJH2_CULSO